jgi:hypothetical protein
MRICALDTRGELLLLSSKGAREGRSPAVFSVRNISIIIISSDRCMNVCVNFNLCANLATLLWFLFKIGYELNNLHALDGCKSWIIFNVY